MGREAFVKLEGAEIFKKVAIHGSTFLSSESAAVGTMPINLMAYDGSGRIFVWNSNEKLLHYVEIQTSGIFEGMNECNSLYSASECKTMKLSVDVNFHVRMLKLNRTGHLLLLVGDRAMMILNVVQQTSQLCRAESVASDMFNGRSLRIVHTAWHPYSDTHIGVLSSDGVFRLFNIAGDANVPEQEYHLQVAFRAKSLARPICFAFGGEHFWERFTVFILFTDASIYALCPVVPFGSLHNVASLKELAGHLSNSNNLTSTETSSLAVVWLEIVFPDLAETGKEQIESAVVLRARPQVPFNASLILQGPLPKLWEGVSSDRLVSYATGIIYNTAAKDSILAMSTKNGEILFYALADEVQPVWNMQSTPRVALDDLGDLITLGMLVEPSGEKEFVQVSEEKIGSGQLLGPSPPLLQLASVDLALQPEVYNASPLGMILDPLVPERIYCHHALGLDVVELQWLPFSDASSGQGIRPPLVFPVMDTSPTGDAIPVPLLGATVILQSSGETWLVAVTTSGKCAVIEMKPHRHLPPIIIDKAAPETADTPAETTALKLISADLLHGPKDIHIPLLSASTPLTLDTVEGRSVLHDQCKLLHEKYIEYGHRVYVELKSHRKYLGEVVQDLEKQLHRASTQLERVQQESELFVSRIQHAFEKNRELQERIRECNKMPALRNKVLTIAEREFKDLLDCKMNQDVDILQAAVESLTLRGDRMAKKQNTSPGYRRTHPRVAVPDRQMRALREAMDRLGQCIELSGRRLEILEQTVKRKEAQLEG